MIDLLILVLDFLYNVNYEQITHKFFTKINILF